MESRGLNSPLLLHSMPFPCFGKLHTQNLCFVKRLPTSSIVVFANRKDSFSEWSGHGQLLVDESMIVLRKRIHEMKMVERNYEPPADWMDWEKKYYTCYYEFVCKFVGFLQLGLMNVRPSLALAMMLLITMSVPVSTVMVGLRLMEAADGLILSAVHLS